MSRPAIFATGWLAVVSLAAPSLGQERVPSEPVPTPWTAEPDTIEPFTPPPLPGLEEARVDEGDPTWLVEMDGYFGLSVAHYNRVDGLAPAWGGRLVPADPNQAPTIGGRIAFATTHSRTLWDAWIRQRLPVPGALVVEAGHFHRMSTFDDWKLSRRENDAATFFAASDLFDWWREKGFRIALDAETPGGRVGGTIRYLDATQSAEPNRNPFALLGDDDDYRPNPAASTGELRSLEFSVRIDTRDVQSPLLPSPGWWIAGQWEAAGGAFGGDVGFSRAAVDVRRYNRIGDDAWWDWRLVWMGPFGDDELPVQRRVNLGGPGSLRGFRAATFQADDGIQGQTEVRLPLPVNDTISLLFLSWHAVAFADAGAVGDFDEWHGDVGLGVSGINVLSYLGFFVAQRVTDFDAEFNGPRVVVRLRRDF